MKKQSETKSSKISVDLIRKWWLAKLWNIIYKNTSPQTRSWFPQRKMCINWPSQIKTDKKTSGVPQGSTGFRIQFQHPETEAGTHMKKLLLASTYIWNFSKGHLVGFVQCFVTSQCFLVRLFKLLSTPPPPKYIYIYMIISVILLCL